MKLTIFFLAATAMTCHAILQTVRFYPCPRDGDVSTVTMWAIWPEFFSPNFRQIQLRLRGVRPVYNNHRFEVYAVRDYRRPNQTERFLTSQTYPECLPGRSGMCMQRNRETIDATVIFDPVAHLSSGERVRLDYRPTDDTMKLSICVSTYAESP